jgi:hypothetical protein
MMRLLVLVLVAGCAAPPSPEPDGGACPLALVVGTTDDAFAFQSLRDGDELKMHLGPQGGYHVYASVRATGLSRQGTLSIEVDGAAGRLTGVRTLDLSTVRLEDVDCGWQRSGDAVIFDALDVSPYRGMPATFRFLLSGTEADQEVSRSVTLQ